MWTVMSDNILVDKSIVFNLVKLLLIPDFLFVRHKCSNSCLLCIFSIFLVFLMSTSSYFTLSHFYLNPCVIKYNVLENNTIFTKSRFKNRHSSRSFFFLVKCFSNGYYKVTNLALLD